MKKLLLSLALTGLWFNASNSANVDVMADKARKAIAHEVARFESQQMTNYYGNQFSISLKQERAEIAKLSRELNDLQFQMSKIDDKNGSAILELTQKCGEARESFTRALHNLEMGLGPNTAAQNPTSKVQ